MMNLKRTAIRLLNVVALILMSVSLHAQTDDLVMKIREKLPNQWSISFEAVLYGFDDMSLTCGITVQYLPGNHSGSVHFLQKSLESPGKNLRSCISISELRQTQLARESGLLIRHPLPNDILWYKFAIRALPEYDAPLIPSQFIGLHKISPLRW